MTVPPHLVTTSVRMEPPSRHPRSQFWPRGRRPWGHLVPAVVATACVCAGFALVSATVPRPATPWNVARSFVEARFDQDWSAVWRLHCRDGRLPDESAFVGRMTTLDEGFEGPAATVVVLEDVTEGGGPASPSFTVTLAIRAIGADGKPMWTDAVRLPVVAERGEFRVCLGPG